MDWRRTGISRSHFLLCFELQEKLPVMRKIKQHNNYRCTCERSPERGLTHMQMHICPHAYRRYIYESLHAPVPTHKHIVQSDMSCAHKNTEAGGMWFLTISWGLLPSAGHTKKYTSANHSTALRVIRQTPLWHVVSKDTKSALIHNTDCKRSVKFNLILSHEHYTFKSCSLKASSCFGYSKKQPICIHQSTAEWGRL